MLLVDTTVWVDHFRGSDSPQTSALRHALANGEDVSICGVILAEVLQGIRDDGEYRRTRSRLGYLVYLPMTKAVFIRSAEMYRCLRAGGITIRKPVDCMIAAVALEHDMPLLHNDRDFDYIAARCGLRVVPV